MITWILLIIQAGIYLFGGKKTEFEIVLGSKYCDFQKLTILELTKYSVIDINEHNNELLTTLISFKDGSQNRLNSLEENSKMIFGLYFGALGIILTIVFSTTIDKKKLMRILEILIVFIIFMLYLDADYEYLQKKHSIGTDKISDAIYEICNIEPANKCFYIISKNAIKSFSENLGIKKIPRIYSKLQLVVKPKTAGLIYFYAPWIFISIITGQKLSENDDFKNCPFCDEMIKSEAIKCRYCGEKFGLTK